MTTVTDVTATAIALAKTEYDRGVADSAATISSITGQLRSVQAAFDAYKLANPEQTTTTPPPAPSGKVVALHDFGVDNPAQSGVALWIRSGTFGGGSDPGAVVYRMPANSSSKTNVSGGTTPWFMMMFGGGSGSTIASDLNVGGFTLDCTQQPNGLIYHGARFGYSNGAKFHDAVVRGARGTGSSPPAETFANPTWHANNYSMTNVVLDGRDAAGNPVGATGWGGTSCTNMSATKLTSNYMAHGFGIAWFLCSGTRTVTDSDLRHNRKAVNIEQDLGGTIKFVRCDFRGTGSPYIAQISTKGLSISAKVTFQDCTFDNDQCVVNTYSTAANGGQNGQKDSDITRVDNGVTQPVGAKFKIVHGG